MTATGATAVGGTPAGTAGTGGTAIVQTPVGTANGSSSAHSSIRRPGKS